MKREYSKIFARPVVVQFGRIDRDRIVVDVRDAAKVLLREWREDSAERTAAMKACIAVLKGKKPARVARKAFVDAAEAARVLVEK